MPKPVKITELNQGAIVQLNDTLEQLWNISNGRYNINIVTSNPDGSLKGDIGDMVLFNNSGTYFIEINTTGGKIWRGVQLTDTP